jgi:hypothetical protein
MCLLLHAQEDNEAMLAYFFLWSGCKVRQGSGGLRIAVRTTKKTTTKLVRMACGAPTNEERAGMAQSPEALQPHIPKTQGAKALRGPWSPVSHEAWRAGKDPATGGPPPVPFLQVSALGLSRPDRTLQPPNPRFRRCPAP